MDLINDFIMYTLCISVGARRRIGYPLGLFGALQAEKGEVWINGGKEQNALPVLPKP